VSRARQKVRVSNDLARQAAGRSAMYSLLARAFLTPDQEFHASVGSGELAETISEIGAELPYALPETDLSPADLPPFIEFQADYIAFFEVGQKAPACPLYEGAFRKDRGRKAIMEDLLRFYHHFDLKMSDKVRELPDQLSAELEFMHYLAFLETGLLEEADSGAGSRLDLVRAQRDFLSRHLAAWAPELAQRAKERSGPEFYCSLTAFMEAFINADLKYLENSLAG
jgi:DMSO reductase family type II enzyme chaperone